MYIKLSVPILLLVTCFRACAQKELYTPTLKNQHNQEINWEECKYIIIGNRRGDGDTGKLWADKIFNYKTKEKEKICAIATIPKWITRTPGSKYFIQKSIFILEKHISIFIDWGEDFSNKNHIYEYPSLLIIYNNMGKITEIGRVTGDYNNKNWKKFISLSNLFNNVIKMNR